MLSATADRYHLLERTHFQRGRHADHVARPQLAIPAM
jgi:hypothetical protein